MLRARDISLLAFYTGLVTVSTLIFTIYVPSTRGYFNVGEAAVYIVALLAGSYAGAFAGGLGSMLSDIILGYFFYAPATLVIKGVEGGVLGFLAGKKPSLSRHQWIVASVAIGVILSLLAYLIGYYVGPTQISLGFPGLSNSITVTVTPLVWTIIGLVASLSIVLTSFLAKPEVGWLVLSAAFSGSLMVLGYFLYEQFVLGFVAVAEVPFNIVQVLVGILIAVPIYNSLKALQWRK
jgi:uncharacterized membrane protein